MSKYSGLDKINVKGLKLIETYRRIKIYVCNNDNHEYVNQGHLVVSRGYCVDSGISSGDHCKRVIDHFLED